VFLLYEISISFDNKRDISEIRETTDREKIVKVIRNKKPKKKIVRQGGRFAL
jgi:uncharacterized protein YerC